MRPLKMQTDHHPSARVLRSDNCLATFWEDVTGSLLLIVFAKIVFAKIVFAKNIVLIIVHNWTT